MMSFHLFEGVWNAFFFRHSKKILACDQIDEGLEFDKRPGNQELILGHILLCHQEGKTVLPRDLTEIVGCTSESLRLMLRGAEKGVF